jgi:DNA-binding NarL/FixJ family response regulator
VAHGGGLPAEAVALTRGSAQVEPMDAVQPSAGRADSTTDRAATKGRDLLGLTAREIDVLRLVARGLTDSEVAQALVISPRTVNGHLTSIYSKLGVSSRTAAARLALDHQLL